MNTKRILSIGQCGFDHGTISSFLQDQLDNVAVDPAASEVDAMAALRARSYDLILVNRILDRDRSKGLDIIRRLKADEQMARIPVMLISNLPDAQETAQSLGAVAGFGKSELDEQAIESVRGVLGV